MKVSRGERLGNYVILIVFAAFALAPIITIVTTALGPETPADAATGGPLHWENFARAWEQANFSTYMTNSVVVALIVVLSATLLSLMSGYALGAFEFPGSQVLFYVFLIGIMVPAEAIVVPLFFDFQTLGWTNTYWAVALPQVAQSVAFGTFWMRAYFRGANRSIIEAARLDGAGHHRVLWQVLVPVARPAIVTMIILSFMWTWNEFLIPLVMSPNGTLRTAPLGLAFFQGQYTQGTTLLAAGAVLVALPMVVLYLFLQRHFIRGMLEGAVKD